MEDEEDEESGQQEILFSGRILDYSVHVLQMKIQSSQFVLVGRLFLFHNLRVRFEEANCSMLKATKQNELYIFLSVSFKKTWVVDRRLRR